jgi:hypothetical protein
MFSLVYILQLNVTYVLEYLLEQHQLKLVRKRPLKITPVLYTCNLFREVTPT